MGMTDRARLANKSELARLIEFSIKVLRDNVPEDGRPYYGCFSGGKDSIVIKALARMANVPIEWHYNVTTIDPPELLRFIKRWHPDVIWDKPRHGNFFVRMERKKGFPTRRGRWCCEDYKEARPPKGVTLVMGIRAEESPRRAKTWGHVTYHTRTKANAVNPILDWASDELWEFIRMMKMPYCELYDEGFHRLGCIGCPMARKSGRVKEFERWPGYEKRWKLSFKRIWERRSGSLQRDGRTWFGDAFFRNWEEMWDWWLNDRALPEFRLDGTRKVPTRGKSTRGRVDRPDLVSGDKKDNPMLTKNQTTMLKSLAKNAMLVDEADMRTVRALVDRKLASVTKTKVKITAKGKKALN